MSIKLMQLLGESQAADDAHKMGLTSAGGPYWMDSKGDIVAKTVNNNLVKVTPFPAKLPTSSTKSEKPEYKPKTVSKGNDSTKAKQKSNGQSSMNFGPSKSSGYAWDKEWWGGKKSSGQYDPVKHGAYDPDKAKQSYTPPPSPVGYMSPTGIKYSKTEPNYDVVNGLPFQEWIPPEDWTQLTDGVNPNLQEPPFDPTPIPATTYKKKDKDGTEIEVTTKPSFKKRSTGAIILEPDGRMWIIEPKNHFGGYEHTFPKGTLEEELSTQQNAIKEVYEESGLQIEITDYLGDFERTTSTGRYFIAKRIGGDPNKAGWESQAVKLIPTDEMEDYLRSASDAPICDAVNMYLGKPVKPKPKKPQPKQSSYIDKAPTKAPDDVDAWLQKFIPDFTSEHISRFVRQFLNESKAAEQAHELQLISAGGPYWMDKTGKIVAKTVKDNLVKYGSKNPQTAPSQNHQASTPTVDAMPSNLSKKLNATFDKLQSAVPGKNPIEPKEVPSPYYYPSKTPQFKQNADSEIASALDILKKKQFNSQPLDANTIMAKKIGGQSGGNAGGFYEGTDGVKRYVKLYKDPQRAHTEKFTNDLYNDLGILAPVAHTFDLDGKTAYASDLFDGKTMQQTGGMTKGAADQLLDGFAADVLCANWDAVGMVYDNAFITADGKVARIDNGGAFTFRATESSGTKPPEYWHKITEWKYLANNNNPTYSHAFKLLGLEDGDALGERALKQIETIQHLEATSGGWENYVKTKAPNMPQKGQQDIINMLKARSELLYKKHEEIANKIDYGVK